MLHDLAFQELKDLVCNAPSLLLPDPTKPFEVETDASDYAIGVVLYQDGKPISFESKKLDFVQCQLFMHSRHDAIIFMAIVLW